MKKHNNNLASIINLVTIEKIFFLIFLVYASCGHLYAQNTTETNIKQLTNKYNSMKGITVVSFPNGWNGLSINSTSNSYMNRLAKNIDNCTIFTSENSAAISMMRKDVNNLIKTSNLIEYMNFKDDDGLVKIITDPINKNTVNILIMTTDEINEFELFYFRGHINLDCLKSLTNDIKDIKTTITY